MNRIPDGISDSSLKFLHLLIIKALEVDDSITEKDKVYGIRQFRDTQETIREIESLLAKRKIEFIPIIL